MIKKLFFLIIIFFLISSCSSRKVVHYKHQACLGKDNAITLAMLEYPLPIYQNASWNVLKTSPVCWNSTGVVKYDDFFNRINFLFAYLNLSDELLKLVKSKESLGEAISANDDFIQASNVLCKILKEKEKEKNDLIEEGGILISNVKQDFDAKEKYAEEVLNEINIKIQGLDYLYSNTLSNLCQMSQKHYLAQDASQTAPQEANQTQETFVSQKEDNQVNQKEAFIPKGKDIVVSDIKDNKVFAPIPNQGTDVKVSPVVPSSQFPYTSFFTIRYSTNENKAYIKTNIKKLKKFRIFIEKKKGTKDLYVIFFSSYNDYKNAKLDFELLNDDLHLSEIGASIKMKREEDIIKKVKSLEEVNQYDKLFELE